MLAVTYARESRMMVFSGALRCDGACRIGSRNDTYVCGGIGNGCANPAALITDKHLSLLLEEI